MKKSEHWRRAERTVKPDGDVVRGASPLPSGERTKVVSAGRARR